MLVLEYWRRLPEAYDEETEGGEGEGNEDSGLMTDLDEEFGIQRDHADGEKNKGAGVRARVTS